MRHWWVGIGFGYNRDTWIWMKCGRCGTLLEWLDPAQEHVALSEECEMQDRTTEEIRRTLYKKTLKALHMQVDLVMTRKPFDS